MWFFDSLLSIDRRQRPVPVAISLSGLWMEEHRPELMRLIEMQKNGLLDITWINHTDRHPYDKTKCFSSNFMLEPGDNMRQEVFGLERRMILAGLVPTVFFRFPGLVSDHRIFTGVESLGLVPVGSNAWLAKGQKISDGAIVLVHANGNEPTGLKDFLALLRSRREEIASGTWMLYGLTESAAAAVR